MGVSGPLSGGPVVRPYQRVGGGYVLYGRNDVFMCFQNSKFDGLQFFRGIQGDEEGIKHPGNF